MKKLMVSNKRLRNTIAIRSPAFRITRCLLSGNLFVTSEMKIILSMPSTISKKVRVNNAIQLSGLKNISIHQN
jgi:hypothetical protein